MNLQSLDIILEDGNQVSPYSGSSADELVARLNDARQQVIDIEHKLGTIKHRMCADLALNIRRLQPGLNVGVDKHGCKIGYKTKILQFAPDVESGIWKVSSPNNRFMREFLNAHRRATLMTGAVQELASAIASHFIAYYRTLHEEISGTGVLMIDEQYGTLTQLAERRGAPKPMLPSRSSRGVCRG